jgi:hypothetical protein
VHGTFENHESDRVQHRRHRHRKDETPEAH